MSRHRDPRRRLAFGVATLVLTALPARRTEPPELETKVFDAINRLPDGLFVPVWPVMQLGALTAVPATAGLAAFSGHRPMATRLLAAGSATWVGAKIVKRYVGRGRPVGLIGEVRVRGRAASGEGFLSGHAGIATTLAATAISTCPDLRCTLVALAATVGLARIYVGAHLPLDVLGGAGLGLTVDAVVTYLTDPT